MTVRETSQYVLSSQRNAMNKLIFHRQLVIKNINNVGEYLYFYYHSIITFSPI